MESSGGLISRASSKRPLGRKSSVSLTITNDEDEQILDLDDNWNFNSMKIFLDKVLVQNNSPNISIIEAINNNITFFQNIKRELQNKYQKFEESFSRPVTPMSFVRQIPITRRALSRSTSISIQPNIHPSSSIKPTKRIKKSHEPVDHHPKQLTSQSIWNSINRFFSTHPSKELIHQYLDPVDPKISAVPLGQHFSIAYNQKLKQRFKTDTIYIKTPEYAEYTTKKIGNFNVVSSYRLLAALIPINHTDESQVNLLDDKDDIEDSNGFQSTNDFNLDNFNQYAYPTNVHGTSYYSKLSFEEKISLEVMSIELNPVDEQFEDVDNEIMNDFTNLRSEYQKILEKTNESRASIISQLAKMEESLVSKQEKYKVWVTMIEKAEKENKSKSSKPKNRDKLS